MPQTIPLRNDLPRFSLQAVLEGTTYTLSFYWNTRLGAWFLDVLDDGGDNVLNAGLRLVADFPLHPYRTGRVPGGLFVAVDTSGKHEDPGLTDLGQRTQLVYFSAAEVGG